MPVPVESDSVDIQSLWRRRVFSSSAEPKENARTPTPAARRWVTLFLLCAAQFLVILDTSIIEVALPGASENTRALRAFSHLRCHFPNAILGDILPEGL